MKVIAISGKAEHGKDETARIIKKILEEDGKKVAIMHFGDVLKFVLKEYFNWNGIKDEHGREILQHIGTEVARKNVSNPWGKILTIIIESVSSEFDTIIIADTRMLEEIQIMQNTFGHHAFFIRVNRVNEDYSPYENTLTEEQRAHRSETELDEYERWNVYLTNRTIKELTEEIKEMIKELKENEFI